MKKVKIGVGKLKAKRKCGGIKRKQNFGAGQSRLNAGAGKKLKRGTGKTGDGSEKVKKGYRRWGFGFGCAERCFSLGHFRRGNFEGGL
ncbi:hypothetical protein AAYQ05_21105 [Flavobacterium sp. B11]|uniref:hypothetical protein n=1 Tax=Flavobacterium movens TaxID=214860 RepID=UPI0031E3B2A7